jgi:hypothetical protein
MRLLSFKVIEKLHVINEPLYMWIKNACAHISPIVADRMKVCNIAKRLKWTIFFCCRTRSYGNKACNTVRN